MPHTAGSALTHHSHVHMIVPGGGLAPDGARWIACRPGSFLPVRVLSRLFRRLFLDGLPSRQGAGRLAFLAALRRAEWVVYVDRPFGGPEAVPAYLSRYTHRVATSDSRLIRSGEDGVTLRWTNHCAPGKAEGQGWIEIMTLKADEFIRRFLIHVLPSGFHRIRHDGLLASGVRAAAVARARELLALTRSPVRPDRKAGDQTEEPSRELRPCPCCGGRMLVIETFERGRAPRARLPSASPSPPLRHACASPGQGMATEITGARRCPGDGPRGPNPHEGAPRTGAGRDHRLAVCSSQGFQTPAVNPVGPSSTTGIQNPLELSPLALARGFSSSFLFLRASSRDQVTPPDRDLLLRSGPAAPGRDEVEAAVGRSKGVGRQGMSVGRAADILIATRRDPRALT